MVASGLKPSIFAASVLNSASVMSLVQHFAEAFLPLAGSAGEKGCEHFAASAGADPGGGQVRFPAVLGKLQRRATVADRKVGFSERPGALTELRFQRPVLHLVDE